MKKIMVLLMVICLATCGCSKDEPPVSNPITETPTQEITATPEPTPTDEPSPTEEVLTAETTCVLCGRITKCTALIDKVWNSDLAMAVDKAYYLCDNCYLQMKESVEVYEKEYDDFTSLHFALNMYFGNADEVNHEIYEQFREVIYGVGVKYVDRYVTFDSTGVHFDIKDDYALEKMKFALVPYLGAMYFSNMKTNGSTYEIRISYDGKEYLVLSKTSPKNPLDKLS